MIGRVFVAALAASAAFAQAPAELVTQPAIRAAFDAVRRNEPAMIDLQVKVCEIPAPPFHEEERGKELKRLFEESGLKEVRIDRGGNVIGVRPGKAARPNLVLSAPLAASAPRAERPSRHRIPRRHERQSHA